MSTQSPKYFYTTDSWDEKAWIDVVSVEYESLVAAYPFNREFRMLTEKGTLKVLDVGCGSAIFPQFLDAALDDDLHLQCDLLDISTRSLDQAEMVLGEMGHFSAGRKIKALIEDIPHALGTQEPQFDVIWAIHSLSTVDRAGMPAVFNHLLELLMPGGHLYIYQLTARSAYQTFHRVYRERSHNAVQRFMEYEDTERIIASLPAQYDTIELSFDHELPNDQPEILENYLRKCVLDESVDTERVFGDIMPQFESGGGYRIPQYVNFIRITRQ